MEATTKHIPCLTNNGSLVLVALPLLTISGIEPNLLVVLLQGSHVLASLGELAFLHALADVPVDKGALGVHQIELVVQPDSSGIRLRKLDFLI